jgi:hypothetical protein
MSAVSFEDLEVESQPYRGDEEGRCSWSGTGDETTTNSDRSQQDSSHYEGPQKDNIDVDRVPEIVSRDTQERISRHRHRQQTDDRQPAS